MKDSRDYNEKIIQLKRFERFILFDHKKASSEKSKYGRSIQAQVPVYDPKMIRQELERLRCRLLKIPTQMTFYLLSKIGTHSMEGLYVDRVGL